VEASFRHGTTAIVLGTIDDTLDLPNHGERCPEGSSCRDGSGATETLQMTQSTTSNPDPAVDRIDGLPSVVALESTGGLQAQLHRRAWETTRKRFGDEVFVRGVVEISNHCRENCHYCGMRRSNRDLKRFRAKLDALLELLIHRRPASITDLNIQAGEDPVAVREIAIPLIRALRRETPLGISVCLGTLSPDLSSELRAAGATTYIIKFETSQDPLYRSFEAPGTLEERLGHIRWLAGNGWRVSSGFISGLPGQGVTGLLEDIRMALTLPLIGCSVSPFVPGESTPLQGSPIGSFDHTLNAMALLRILRPDWVIPAVSALNIVGAASGYRAGLRAGANLCTINLTPAEMRDDYLLYKRDRFIMDEERVLSAVTQEGLQVSSRSLASFLGA
jgi:biotin synthase